VTTRPEKEYHLEPKSLALERNTCVQGADTLIWNIVRLYVRSLNEIDATLNINQTAMIGGRLIFSLLALPAYAWADRYTLHHRIDPSSAWSARGIITLDEGGTGPSYQDLTGNDRPWAVLSNYKADSSHLYQLALTIEGVSSVGSNSPITFTKAVSRSDLFLGLFLARCGF
jgi:hypothetical protein